MNPRTTGILLLVAALLGAVVWWSNRREAGQQEAEEQAKKLFAAVEAGAIEWIELGTSDGREARLERRDGAWRLTRPLDFAADPSTADAMASALADITSESVIEDAQAPAVYGLADEARVVRFGVGDARHELRVGKKTPLGANQYAATGADQKVYTVPSFQLTSLEKPLDDLRERRPLRFDREGLARIELTWQDGGVVLEKRDGSWHMTAPLDVRADGDTVDTLLSDLVFLRATGFLDEPPPDAELGLDAPSYRVVLVDAAEEEGGREPLRHELAVGGLLDGNVRAARGDEGAVYQIANERFDKLPKTVVAFRWKELANFVAADAQRFELSFADPDAAAEGATQIVTIEGTRGDEGWSVAPDDMRPGLAGGLVAELARLDADDIAAEEMGPEELAGLGLAPPRVTVRVLGAAPADGGEAPELAQVQLGVQKGDRLYAKVPDRKTVYVLPARVAEQIPISLDAFRGHFAATQPQPEAGAGPAGAQETTEPSTDASPAPGTDASGSTPDEVGEAPGAAP